MNRKFILQIVGKIFITTALLMLLPLGISALYGEWEECFFAFLISIGISLALGLPLQFGFKVRDKVIYAKEGFLIVALAWLSMSVVGALPFVISREIPNYIDAFFETVSGFTTTGASIVTDVESMSHGILFWRSFTHWFGGMGILVFVMAIVPNTTDRSIHILRAESPGPIIGKLVPRMRDTAKILYIIYFVFTVVEFILLAVGGMPVFDSVLHALGTAGTGGFGIKADGLASYSAYSQWVITIFMMIFGVNFNAYFLILNKKFKTAFSSTEVWTYIGISFAATVIIVLNLADKYPTIGETIRHTSFQIASIMTTTGYSTVDFNLWPETSKTVLLMLMFIGGCAGSTAGGFKVSRVVIIFKMIKQEVKRLLHPRAVTAVRFEGKTVEEPVQKSLMHYLAIYVLLFGLTFVLISFDKYDFVTNFSAAASCFNNIGPALGAAGPAASYSGYSYFSKIILSFAMLFGRLEIYPMLFLFVPSAWSKNK